MLTRIEDFHFDALSRLAKHSRRRKWNHGSTPEQKAGLELARQISADRRKNPVNRNE